MNKLTEALHRLATQDLVKDDDYEGLGLDPTYKWAVEDGKKIADNLEDDFKNQKELTDEFIQENNDKEKKLKGTVSLKRMKLSESLFDNIDDDDEEYNESILGNIVKSSPIGMLMGGSLKEGDDVTEDIDLEDPNSDYYTVIRYLDMEIPDMCRIVLDAVENMSEVQLSQVASRCRDFYNYLESKLSSKMTEAYEFGGADQMGRAQCSPLVPDFSKSIKDYVKHYGEDPKYDNTIKKSLKGFVEKLQDSKQEVENFNSYWNKRYPLLIKYIDDQIALIPFDVIGTDEKHEEDVEDLDESKSINEAVETFTIRNEFTQSEDTFEDHLNYLKERDEAAFNVEISGKQIDDNFCDITITGTPEAIKKYKTAYQLTESKSIKDNKDKINESTITPKYYYQNKREPLADIIQRELTVGEIGYVDTGRGKLSPTKLPSLLMDEDDIGIDKNYNIVANSDNEQLTQKIINIAKKYNKKYSVKTRGTTATEKPFDEITIYIDDKDWDEPYFDPNVATRATFVKQTA